MVLSPKSQIMQWGCLLIVSIIFLAGGGKYAFAVKATPPLNLSLTSRTLSDGQTELTLKAIANLTVDKADLTIVLPASLDLASGGLQWEGAIAIGEKKEVKVLVRTLANIQALVIGKATVYFTHGGSLLQQQTLLLNAPKKKASPPAKPPTLRKQGRDTILEFR